MPRPAKTRVCSETEKRKAEIFNHIDDLILTGRWSEASENLQYLYRNAPSLRTQVKRKLAWLNFEIKNYQKALAYLQDLIPTKEAFINRMVIKCLLRLDKKHHAIFHLAKTPLPPTTKQELFYLIFPELKKEYIKEDVKVPRLTHRVTIRCPKCTRFLFFAQNKPICLFCDSSIFKNSYFSLHFFLIKS